MVIKTVGNRLYNPIELGQGVIKAVDNKIGTKKEIAETFFVSTSWIRKLLQCILILSLLV